MTLKDFYTKFPTQEYCLSFIENIRWSNTPICPYCKSFKVSNIFNEKRYHCNTCNTSFSVTVKTIFHKSKVELQKWFFAIYLFNKGHKLSCRELAKQISVNKNTAMFIISRIKKARMEQMLFLENFNMEGISK